MNEQFAFGEDSMIVLDTSALIELIKGRERGRKILDYVKEERIAITTVTVNEFFIGATEKEKERFETVFSLLEILPFDSDAAYRSVVIEEDLEHRGQLIGKLDIFIAAIAHVSGFPLVTLDNDFSRIKDLKTIVL